MSLGRDDLSVIEGDARISDRRLMEELGYARIANVHEVIKDHWEELEDYGRVFLEVRKNPEGGRPSHHYFLNEHQAVTVCILARTEKARAARRQVVEVFLAWRHGDGYGLAAKRQTDSPFLDQARHTGHVVRAMENLSKMDDFHREVANLPIWTNGRRPRWWGDIEVREFLTATHRQMTTMACELQGKAQYGDRFPCKSSINDYWQKLDRVKRERFAR